MVVCVRVFKYLCLQSPIVFSISRSLSFWRPMAVHRHGSRRDGHFAYQDRILVTHTAAFLIFLPIFDIHFSRNLNTKIWTLIFGYSFWPEQVLSRSLVKCCVVRLSSKESRYRASSFVLQGWGAAVCVESSPLSLLFNLIQAFIHCIQPCTYPCSIGIWI